MKIGILGTGRMGRALAAQWAAAGHEIFLASREAQRAHQAALELGSGVKGCELGEAAALADVLLLAFPWYALIDVARAIHPLSDKILVDCINPLTSSGSLALGHSRSAAEEIQAEFPRCRVVKAFNHIYFEHFKNPVFSGQPADALLASDYDDAREIAGRLAADIGLQPVDCGPLKFARYLEPLALLWIQKAFHLGQGPEFTIKFLPRE